MMRPIRGFESDPEGHWVATLSCGHGQHTRHDPPAVERPWVLTPEGRAARVGAELDCVRCDRLEMPEGFAPYKRTRAFTEQTVPKGLLADHTTAAGVWALIHVTEGRLLYRVESLGLERILTPGTPGTVAAEVPHRVACDGAVAFYVAFWKAAAPA